MTRPPPTEAGGRRPRGFALLIVLWTVGLLALIGAQVTAAGRTEARLASNLRGSAIAEAAADAAVQEAGMRLLRAGAAQAGAATTSAIPPAYLLRLPQAAVEVTIASESRKLPINTAPVPTLTALLTTLGANERTAISLASQIADWRSPANFPLKRGAKAPQYKAAGRAYGPSNRPFRSLEDLGLVLAMTPTLLARLAPHVSVYTQSAPKPVLADPVVLQALRSTDSNGLMPLTFDEPPVYRVTALARAAGGGEFLRRAVIRVNAGSDAGTPTRVMDILAWSQGAAGPMAD